MLRGNHESRSITEFFNFKAEVAYKYGIELYDVIMDVFDSLPLAATIDVPDLPGTFFCCHGGLGPDVKKIEELQSIDRFMEPPEDGAFALVSSILHPLLTCSLTFLFFFFSFFLSFLGLSD